MRALVGPAAEPRPARTEAAVMALVTGNGALLPRPEQRAVLEDAAAQVADGDARLELSLAGRGTTSAAWR